MQNDIATNVARALNEKPEMARELVDIIKNQASEIQKRGHKIVDLEDKNDMLQKNVQLITSSNKQLESMIETLKAERVKLLEEIEDLKKCSATCETKIKKTKSKTSNEKVQ
jgi:chromosome segregation ATPase